MPRVSVVLPVFNGAEYLQQAIDSILSQSFQDLELIAVDDASTDASLEILSQIDDSRLLLHSNPMNLGLPGTLNVGIQLASGEYLARQDQDDYSALDRIKKQVAFLDGLPNVGMVGTWATILRMGDDGAWIPSGTHRHPGSDPLLRFRMLWNSPFVHSSMMMRRSVLDAAGGYAQAAERQCPEDYELWSRMARHADVANLPEVLQFYRQSPGGMSQTQRDRILQGVIAIGSENLGAALGLGVTDPDVVAIVSILNGVRGLHGSPRTLLRQLNLLSAAARSIDRFPLAAHPQEIWLPKLRLIAHSAF